MEAYMEVQYICKTDKNEFAMVEMGMRCSKQPRSPTGAHPEPPRGPADHDLKTIAPVSGVGALTYF